MAFVSKINGFAIKDTDAHARIDEIAKGVVYELEVLSTDSVWETNGEKVQVRIPKTTHKFTKIHSIIAERKTETDMCENMIYSYKRYLSGSVAVIVDSKIDMRIIIKGEK